MHINNSRCRPVGLNHAKYGSGFSLIELMIAVAIVAILSAVAVPGYDSYMVKARRSEVKTILARGALWMERNQSASYSYGLDSAGAALTAASLSAVGLGRSPESGGTTWYLITLDTPVAANSFQIRATAQGTQATKDAGCAVLIMNQLGQRGRLSAGVSEYTTQLARDCWAQ
jgi:type IV pilus assembly protein PilE